MDLKIAIQQFRKNRFVRFGVPFLILLVGGSFGLEHFARLRYDFRKTKRLKLEEVEEATGLKLKSEEDRPTIEKEVEKLKNQDLDHWQNIRGPRPWEDSKTMQAEPRKSS